MSRKSKATQHKVWIHIEGLNDDGDTVEGDEYFEPHEAGCFDTAEEAEDLRDRLEAAAEGWTVILLYPDYISNEKETYMEWSDEPTEEAAIADVRRKAVAAQIEERHGMDPLDFALIGVIRGHHEMSNPEY